jgi:hypothetical protein
MVVIISSIPIQNLRNTEVIQFNSDMLEIIKRNDPTALKVQKQFDAYTVANQTISTLFKKDTANPITDTITALDLRRDNSINGISTVINGFTYHFDPTTNIAANLLNNHLLSYGKGIARLNYQSKTTTLTSILEDWADKPDLAAAITFLQLNDWVQEMQTANIAFNDSFIDRAQDIGGGGDTTMKAMRLEAANAYYDIRNKLNAYLNISEGPAADPYIKVINEINALIDQYNRLLAGRGGGGDVPPVPPVI